MLPKTTLEKIERDVLVRFPMEACGLILKDFSVIPMENHSETPEKSFVIPLTEYCKHIENLHGVYHSHTKSKFTFHICTPSLADAEQQKALNLPFYIAGFDGSYYTQPVKMPADPNNKYTGRPYIYGLSDCATLMRDYYLYKFGVNITLDIKHSLSPKSAWQDTIKFFLLTNNFVQLRRSKETNKHGDILLTSVGGGIDNHGMLFLENGLILNQDELSVFTPLSSFDYVSDTFYRYKDFL